VKTEKQLLVIRIEDVADFEIHDVVLQIHDLSISPSEFQLSSSETRLATDVPARFPRDVV